MAGQVSASDTIITNRSDFENLVIEKKLKRFLISLSVTSDGKIKVQQLVGMLLVIGIG